MKAGSVFGKVSKPVLNYSAIKRIFTFSMWPWLDMILNIDHRATIPSRETKHYTHFDYKSYFNKKNYLRCHNLILLIPKIKIEMNKEDLKDSVFNYVLYIKKT